MQVSVIDAEARLSDLIEAALAGEVVPIVRGSGEAVRIEPIVPASAEPPDDPV